MQGVRVKRREDVGSDHHLLVAEVKIKLFPTRDLIQDVMNMILAS